MMRSKIFKVGTVLFFVLMCNLYLGADNGKDKGKDDIDDTPPDIHYEVGMGCIDCHGSFDMLVLPSNPNHEPTSMNHKTSLISYIVNTSPEAAASVNIDLGKLNDYISKL